MYISCNNDACLRNHCHHGKVISIIYPAHVSSLSYLACKTHMPYYNVICDLSGSTTFFHILSKMKQFLGKSY